MLLQRFASPGLCRVLVAGTLLLLLAFSAGCAALGTGSTEPIYTQTTDVEKYKVTLQVSPLLRGERTIDVRVHDQAGGTVALSDVNLRLSMPYICTDRTDIVLAPASEGRYAASGKFFWMSGAASADVLFQGPDKTLRVASFVVPVDTPDAVAPFVTDLAADAALVAEGQKLYAANCASCHGASGRGDGPQGKALDASDFTQHMAPDKHTDAQVYLAIRNGRRGTAMPAWGDKLSDAQLWQLVGYLRTFAAPSSVATNSYPVPQGAASVYPAPQVGPNPGISVPVLPQANTPATVGVGQVPDASEPLPPVVFTRNGDLWRSDEAGAAQLLVKAAMYPGIQSAASSADGRLIAYTHLEPIDNGQGVTTALNLTALDGTQPRLLWRPKEGFISTLAWTPDGKAIYAGVGEWQRKPGTNEVSRVQHIVRVDVASGTVRSIVPGGITVALSPQGDQLAFTRRVNSYQTQLELATPDGSDARVVVPVNGFEEVYAPRFAPDGQSLIFVAVGGPPTDAAGYPVAAAPTRPLDALMAFFAPVPAEAHGEPYDLWTAQADGSGLRRLTALAADDLRADISPDAREIILSSADGIYRMNQDGSSLRRIDPAGTHGGTLDWIEP
jgi:mono/diheme cytochrome c family protein